MYYLRGDFLILLVVLLVCGLKCSHGAAFLTPPRQPAGLSSEAIVDLARNRFGEELLKDRVVVITGAAGGIGRQLCQVVIHELGGTVVALDRNVTGLELLRQECKRSCDNNLRLDTILTCHEDLSSVASSAQRIKEKYPKIDVLINNAGMAYSADRPPGLSAHGHDLAFTVNYLSHFLLTEALLPCLGSDGRIVFMTSTYHWKVNGSELMVADEEEESKSNQKDNTNIMNGPVAYQGVPENQSPKHGTSLALRHSHGRCCLLICLVH
jgi:NAD(P)-dependent dehydrogenase (short-subunit alcohol dehydrogenase family)